ncbi:hypothetical protein ASF47_07950 [Nocardioides sp. Leaf285]|nr:hypothetical protein ASF47_07950 [Nocardioides sp. Leaf285]
MRRSGLYAVSVRRLLAVGFFLALTVLALLLLAGHGPWAGESFWAFDESHGLNTGDVPVLAIWGMGVVGCVLLWTHDS